MKISKFFLFASILACASICFTSCTDDSIKDNTAKNDTPEGFESQEFEPHDLRTYTEEEVNLLVEEFTGESSEGMTVKDKVMVLADIRKSEYDIPDAASKRMPTYNVFAASVIKLTSGTLLFADDGDFSPFPATISANADQKRDAPVNATQIWSFAVIEVDGVNVDSDSFNEFNYSCTDDDHELRLRANCFITSSGFTFTNAYEVCQD